MTQPRRTDRQTPVPSTNNTVTGNTINGNFGGCAIVIEAWVASLGSGTTVSNNHIQGASGMFGPHGPVIGQIVVATNAPGATLSRHHGQR